MHVRVKALLMNCVRSSMVLLYHEKRVSWFELPLLGTFRLFFLDEGTLITTLTRKLRPLFVPSDHDHMPVILNSVIGAPWEQARNDRPSVSIDLMSRKQQLVLVLCERLPVDSWIQLIEPSQPTTLSWLKQLTKTFLDEDFHRTGDRYFLWNQRTWSSLELFSDGVPVVRAIFGHQCLESLIFCRHPVTLGVHILAILSL